MTHLLPFRVKPTPIMKRHLHQSNLAKEQRTWWQNNSQGEAVTGFGLYTLYEVRPLKTAFFSSRLFIHEAEERNEGTWEPQGTESWCPRTAKSRQ